MLIRNLLLAQHDGNAAIVLAGPATGVVAAARPVSARGRRSRRRSSSWSSPPDRFRPGRRSRAIKSRRRRGAQAVRRVADADRRGRHRKSETRCRIPGASIEKDFAWSPAHPVVDAYRAVQADAVRRAGRRRWRRCSMPSIRTTAISSCPSPARSACSTTAGRSSRPGADGKHRYLIVDPAQKDRVIDAVHAPWCPPPPAPRPGRGRGAAANETSRRCCRSRARARCIAGGEHQVCPAQVARLRRAQRSVATSTAPAGRPRRPTRRRPTPPRDAAARAAAARPAAHPPSAAAFAAATKSLFEDTCSECHNSSELAGGLDVEPLHVGRVARRRSRPVGADSDEAQVREMPPEDVERPDERDRRAGEVPRDRVRRAPTPR